MATQPNDQNPNKRNPKNNHRPINKSGKCCRIISSRTCTAPVIKPPAPHQAHQSCTEHTAISHTGQHPTYDNRPKGSRYHRLICAHVKPPKLFKIKTLFEADPSTLTQQLRHTQQLSQKNTQRNVT